MYKTLGYYMDCDEAICTDCVAKLPDLPADEQVNAEYPWWHGFESWEAPLAISEADESDSPTHCSECGVLLDHSLTTDGYMMVLDSVIEGFTQGKQNPVVVQWLNAYEEYVQDALDGEYIDTEAGTVEADDAMTLYRLLPHDEAWGESNDPRLNQHAVHAGWLTPEEVGS